jgi:hypothetical protein
LQIEINKSKPAAVLPSIAKTMTDVLVACHFVQPGEVPAMVQHIDHIRDCLDAFHDFIEKWEVQ